MAVGVHAIQRQGRGARAENDGSLARSHYLCEGAVVSEFVDYTKRSVDLPPGCRDLADVLKSKFNSEGVTSPGGARRFLFGGLADIPGEVNWLLADPRPSNRLMIFTKQDGLCLSYRNKHGPLELYLTVPCINAERIKAIRAFFTARNISALEHVTAGAQHFCYALPRVAREVAVLLIDLLKKVFGFDQTAKCYFVFRH